MTGLLHVSWCLGPENMSQTNVPDLMYECLDALGGDRVRVRFAGRLLGESVTWDATLCTLAAASHPARRFIEVGETTSEGTRLTVGLDVARIDRPTVLKTVIMIRGWKNLRPGRHDYGAPVGVAG